MAILLNHMNDYFKYISRTKQQDIEINEQVQHMNKIDYHKLHQQAEQTENQNDDNLIDLMNDIF